MDYPEFERPKLPNAKSLKHFSYKHDIDIPFRHKNLPKNHHYLHELHLKRDDSLGQQSSSYKKCPIYRHSFKMNQKDGDHLSKKKTKEKHKAFEKLEETYWANWKPDKNVPRKTNLSNFGKDSPRIKVIKTAPERRRKIRLYPKQATPRKSRKSSNHSQEIQTEFEPKPELIKGPAMEELKEEKLEDPKPSFLKHTDSLILTKLRQKTELEPTDQPRCIRLYQKPGRMSSRNFVKGGSYPLKSCMKKHSFSATSKLTRPGSPIISSSGYGQKKLSKSHRH